MSFSSLFLLFFHNEYERCLEKYDAQPGPNGPIPRVYFQFTGLDRKETPMAITSVESAQDVLTQLERFVNSEQ